MVLQQPPARRPPQDEDVEAGVIDDARSRQRRHRNVGAALLAAALVAAGLIVGLTGGSGGSGGGAGRGLGPSAAGAPLHHQSLRSVNAALLARTVKRCDRREIGSRRGLGGVAPVPKNPFAGHLVLSATGSGYVGLIADAGGAHQFCLSAVRPTGYTPGGGGDGIRLGTPGPGMLSDDGTGSFGALAGSVSEEIGRAGKNVSAVELVFAHRPALEAMVEHGWYFAFWPGSARTLAPTRVLVTTPSGTVSSPPDGQKCRLARTCVFVSQPVVPRAHARIPPVQPASNPIGTIPTLAQLMANFAVLRRPQNAADRGYRLTCGCGGAARQVQNLTRMAAKLPDGSRVFLGLQQSSVDGGLNQPAGSYVLSLTIVNRKGDTSGSSYAAGNYFTQPIVGSNGGRLLLGGGLRIQHGTRVFASIVPDGVATVTWTFRITCTKGPVKHQCPAVGTHSYTIPVVNNVAAAMLPAVDGQPFYAGPAKVVWRSRTGRVLTAFKGYGNLPSPPFFSGRLNTGSRHILEASGVAGAKIGTLAATAIAALTKLIGAPAERNVAVFNCGVNAETVWSSPTLADPLTFYERGGRLVGYQYGAEPNQIGLVQGPGAVLMTAAGLTVNSHIDTARRLYGQAFITTSTPKLGYWRVGSGALRLHGYSLPNRYPAHAVQPGDPVATIGAGDTGCPEAAG